VLGACGILFIGITFYIYFVVDHSIDNEVNAIIDSVKDLDKGKGPDTSPLIDPNLIKDAAQTINTPQPTASTSTADTSVKGYDLNSEGSLTPKGGNNILPVNENPVTNTTTALASDLTKIVKTGQESLSKVSEGVKNISSNVVETTQNVTGKVTSVVKTNTSKLHEMGRTLVAQTAEHISDTHQKASALHNPIARPVIDTKGLITGSEAADIVFLVQQLIIHLIIL
jgi:methyl-accepting chemotaxis protein